MWNFQPGYVYKTITWKKRVVFEFSYYMNWNVINIHSLKSTTLFCNTLYSTFEILPYNVVPYRVSLWWTFSERLGGNERPRACRLSRDRKHSEDADCSYLWIECCMHGMSISALHLQAQGSQIWLIEKVLSSSYWTRS